jgi:uncharacterized protein
MPETDQMEFKTFPFELKAATGDGSSFEGLVSVFNNVDSYGEIVDPHAFDEDLPEFLSSGFIGGLNHDWDNPIGTPQPGTKVVPEGLFLKANVIDTSHGMDVRKMLKAGVVKTLSIGFKRLGATVLETADDVSQYWKKNGYTPSSQDIARAKDGFITVLTRIKNFEGSPVTMPANDRAFITAVKAARDAANAAFKDSIPAPDPCPVTEPDAEQAQSPTTVRQLEKFLRDAGLTQVKAKEAVSLAKSLLRDVESVEVETEPETEPEVTEEPATETVAEDIVVEEDAAEPVETSPSTLSEDTPDAKPRTLSLEEEEIRRKKQRVAQMLHQRFRETDAKIARSLLNAGAMK